jgi:hypothetical protein
LRFPLPAELVLTPSLDIWCQTPRPPLSIVLSLYRCCYAVLFSFLVLMIYLALCALSIRSLSAPRTSCGAVFLNSALPVSRSLRAGALRTPSLNVTPVLSRRCRKSAARRRRALVVGRNVLRPIFPVRACIISELYALVRFLCKLRPSARIWGRSQLLLHGVGAMRVAFQSLTIAFSGVPSLSTHSRAHIRNIVIYITILDITHLLPDCEPLGYRSSHRHSHVIYSPCVRPTATGPLVTFMTY